MGPRLALLAPAGGGDHQVAWSVAETGVGSTDNRDATREGFGRPLFLVHMTPPTTERAGGLTMPRILRGLTAHWNELRLPLLSTPERVEPIDQCFVSLGLMSSRATALEQCRAPETGQESLLKSSGTRLDSRSTHRISFDRALRVPKYSASHLWRRDVGVAPRSRRHFPVFQSSALSWLIAPPHTTSTGVRAVV